MRITATTSAGTIAITAVDDLTRSYNRKGASRAVEMEHQDSRFFGSLGLFHDGVCVHWRDHHGIARCFTEEGQQDFKTVEEVMKWCNEPKQKHSVNRDHGLMVGWSNNLGGKALHVDVWQNLVDGKKPKRLHGSQKVQIVI